MGYINRINENAFARDLGGADFLCMGDRFYGTFPTFIWKSIHLLAVDYVSKWVEAIACPRNDANIVVGFIQRNILSRFRVLRIIIGDEESHFEKQIV